MYLITEITEFSKTKFRLLFADNSFLVVYKGMIDTNQAQFSDEEFAELYKKMLSYAKKRAMSLLVKKNYSVQGLTDKLEADGYNSSIINEVRNYLDSYHYLDDERVAENLVRVYRNSKSRQQTAFLLKKQKLPDIIIEEAIARFYNDPLGDYGEAYNNELELIKRLLQKKNLTPEKIKTLDYKEKQKVAASLFRKGYRSENIKNAINLDDFE